MTTVGGLPARTFLERAKAAQRVARWADMRGLREPPSELVDLGQSPLEQGRFVQRHMMTAELYLDPTHGRDRNESPTPMIPDRWIYELGPQFVHGHTGIVAHGSAIIRQSGPALKDICLVAAKAGAMTAIVAARSGQRRPIEIASPVFPLGREPIAGYYHWIVDILPRVLRAVALYPDLTVIGSKIPTWAKAFLDGEGIRSYKTSGVIWSPQVLVADHTYPTVHPSDVDILRAAGRRIASAVVAPQSSSRVFVTRTGARRAVLDGEAVDSRAEDLGMEVMIPSRYPDYATQVAVFREAREIVGLHGAGLVNMVFASPGAEVIEVRVDPAPLRGAKKQRAVRLANNPDFRNLAISAGHQYSRETITPSDEAPFGRAVDVITILERRLSEDLSG